MENMEMISKVKGALLAMQRFSWEQGVSAQAFLEGGDLDLVVRMAYAAQLRQGEDGRLALMAPDEALTDPASNGEPMLRAAEITGDRSLKDAVLRNVDLLLNRAPRSREGVLFHWAGKKIVMIDSSYMVPPLLVVTGHAEEAMRQMEGFRKLLWDEGKKLFRHMWNEEKGAFERDSLWGVGNGWAAMGMTRMIRSLPDTMPEARKTLQGQVRELLGSCIGFMRQDGLFHDVLDDSGSFLDANCGQAFAYSIFRGVKGGWVDPFCLGAAKAMRAAAWNKVDRWGIVREVCGAPHFVSQGIAPEAQAFFLLMEAAYHDLTGYAEGKS